MFVYLDNSATTKPDPMAVKAISECMEDDYGNASSLHLMGLSAEKRIQNARKSAARLLHGQADEVIFTSGGTESDNTAILGTCAARKRYGNKIITTAIEHPAVLESCKQLEAQGFQVVYLSVDQRGLLRLSDLEQQLDDQTILVTVMHVNNEIGTIQPLPEIASLVKRSKNAAFHTDAVQSFGKLPLDVQACGIDLLSASAHKLYGPKGIGLLYRNKKQRLNPYLLGGGQENGLRSGTENVPGISGFDSAMSLAFDRMEKGSTQVQKIKDYLWNGILSEIPDCQYNGSLDKSAGSPYVMNVSFPGTRGEVLLHMLEQADVYVSTGSACSSRKKGQSHVLKSIGLTNEQIEGAIRFSFHHGHTLEEMDYVINVTKKAVLEMRKLLKYRTE